MKIQIYIATYNRPKIAAASINSLLKGSTNHQYDIFIVDDGSDIEFQTSLFNFSNFLRDKIRVTPILKNKNEGISCTFEDIYLLMKKESPDIAVLVESDYIWRNGWLDDVISVYEANPYVVAIPGTSHPDMYDRNKTHGDFVELCKKQFGNDLESRQHLYSPFILETKNGPIKVQGVSNCCCCHILFWNRFTSFVFDDLKAETEYWKHMDRCFHKIEDTNRYFISDAHMSITPAYLWERWAIKNGIDITKNFAWLDICDYSIGQHICGGGLCANVPWAQEGQTFVGSPVWPNNWENFTRK